jgi:hypothetical protein
MKQTLLTHPLEAEILVKIVVEEVFNTPSLTSHRDVLLSHLLKRLEADTNWMDPYRVTGELDIPGTCETYSDEVNEALSLVKQVRVQASSSHAN